MIWKYIVSLAFPIALFLSIWLFTLFILVKMSGLDKLGVAYGDRTTFLGKTYPLCSGYIGRVRFKGALTIGISEQALYLKPFFLFLLGNPPILIPWREIDSIEEKKEFWLKYYAITVYCPERIVIKLPARVFRAHPEILEPLLDRYPPKDEES